MYQYPLANVFTPMEPQEEWGELDESGHFYGTWERQSMKTVGWLNKNCFHEWTHDNGVRGFPYCFRSVKSDGSELLVGCTSMKKANALFCCEGGAKVF